MLRKLHQVIICFPLKCSGARERKLQKQENKIIYPQRRKIPQENKRLKKKKTTAETNEITKQLTNIHIYLDQQKNSIVIANIRKGSKENVL